MSARRPAGCDPNGAVDQIFHNRSNISAVENRSIECHFGERTARDRWDICSRWSCPSLPSPHRPAPAAQTLAAAHIVPSPLSRCRQNHTASVSPVKGIAKAQYIQNIFETFHSPSGPSSNLKKLMLKIACCLSALPQLVAQHLAYR